MGLSRLAGGDFCGHEVLVNIVNGNDRAVSHVSVTATTTMDLLIFERHEVEAVLPMMKGRTYDLLCWLHKQLDPPDEVRGRVASVPSLSHRAGHVAARSKCGTTWWNGSRGRRARPASWDRDKKQCSKDSHKCRARWSPSKSRG